MAVILRGHGTHREVLLVRRATRVGDPWSGHIAFPGGRRDPDDRDSTETAIRETREEVGLDLTERPIGRLSAYLTRTHRAWRPMAVDPIGFEWAGKADMVFNHEVAEAFWVPLQALREGPRVRRIWQVGAIGVPMPAWDWEGHVIWGLTYAMLRELLATGLRPD